MGTLKLRRLLIGALFAALICVTTFTVKFPTITGYIHIGDGFVILAGILLGSLYGSLAAGIGSMLADLLAGYPQFALATFIIKGLVALLCGLLSHRRKTRWVIVYGILGSIIIVLGYFLYEIPLYGIGAALKSIAPNIVQCSVGVLIAHILFPILIRIPSIKELISHS